MYAARKFSETSTQARVPLRLKECDGTSRNIVNDEDFQELDDGTEIMVEISTPPTLPFLKVNRREAKDAPDEETLKSVLTARLMKFPDLMEFMTQREMKLLITANSQLEPEAGIDLQEKLQQKLDVRRLLKEGVDIITKDFIIPTRKYKSKEKKILAVLKRRNIPKFLVSDRLFECSRCDTEGDPDTLIYKLLRRPKLISNLNSKKLETVAYSDMSCVRAPRIVSNYVKNACTIRLREILRSNLIEAFLEMHGETIGV